MEQDLKDLYNDCNEKNSVTLEENDTLKVVLSLIILIRWDFKK
jgi:hypothetical protein